MKALLRTSLTLLVLVVVLLVSAPGLIYLAGIGSVEGRPQPDAPPLRPAQRQWLRCELRADGRPEAPITDPWSYALRVLRRDVSPSYGDEMSWIIARHYNATHSKRQRAMERMLSGMSMSSRCMRCCRTPRASVASPVRRSGSRSAGPSIHLAPQGTRGERREVGVGNFKAGKSPVRPEFS